MAMITIDGDRVEIRLSLVEEVLSVHGSLHIPLQHIRHATVDPVSPTWWRGFRVGAHIPGVIAAGTFFTAEGAIFYDFRHGDRCVTLDLTSERYRRVVVEVDASQDPAKIAAEIEAARERAPGR